MIIDDASTDTGVKEVAQQCQAEYVRVRKARGSAFCKNLGVAASRGEYLLFLDSDAEFIDSNALSAMLNLFSDDTLCGEGGGEAIVDSEQRAKYIFGRILDEATGRSSIDYKSAEEYQEPIEVDYIPTSNCMVRRDVVLRLNGFDDAYPHLGEDMDFGYRVKRLGLKNYVLRESVVLHHFAPDGRRADQLSKGYRTQVRFFMRHCNSSTLRFLLKQEAEIRSSQKAGAKASVHVDPAIAEFEDHYMTAIIKTGASGSLTHSEDIHYSKTFIQAFLWCELHRLGLRQQGSHWVGLSAAGRS